MSSPNVSPIPLPSILPTGMPWWGNLLVTIGGSFAATFLTGLMTGLSPKESAIMGGAAALGPIYGIPKQAKLNPDGTDARLAYKAGVEPPVKGGY
jgi:hypothetical protein